MKSININVTTKTIFVFFGVLSLLTLVVICRDILLLIFASYVIACSLLPSINFLNKIMPRNLAITIVYISVIAAIVILMFPFVNIMIREGTEFIRQLSNYWIILEKTLEENNIFISEIDLSPNIKELSSILTSVGENVFSQTIHFTHNIMTWLIMFTTLAILVLFFLLEESELTENFLKFFPHKHREQVLVILSKISHGVGVYVASKIVLMFVVFIMSAVGLQFLGVKFAIFLGFIAGCLEILPMIGPIVASFPAIIVALTQDPKLALGVIILYFIIFKVANNILSPIILGKFLNISPIIIIGALFIGSSTLGIAGIVLSPAIVVVIMVLCQELYLKNIERAEKQIEQTQDSSVTN